MRREIHEKGGKMKLNLSSIVTCHTYSTEIYHRKIGGA